MSALEGPCGDTTIFQSPDDFWKNVGCDATVKVSNNVLEAIFTGVSETYKKSVGAMNYLWLSMPEPQLSDTGPIPSMWADMRMLTLGFAIIGFLFAVIRMALSSKGQPVIMAIMRIVMLGLIQSGMLFVTSTLLTAGNEFSTWIIGKGMSTSNNFNMTGTDQPFEKLVLVVGLLRVETLGSALAGFILMLVLTLLSLIMQLLFLVVRSVLLVILLMAFPVIAAGALFESGRSGFNKAVAWWLSCLLYKPAAACIYALGFYFMSNVGAKDPKLEEIISNLMVGTIVIGFAALALPMLIKFVSPVAGAGVSAMFSGGALAAGVIAVGATVATMGGAAAAGGGAAAASGGGTATAKALQPTGSITTPAPTPAGSPTGAPSSGGQSAAPAPAPAGAPSSGGQSAAPAPAPAGAPSSGGQSAAPAPAPAGAPSSGGQSAAPAPAPAGAPSSGGQSAAPAPAPAGAPSSGGQSAAPEDKAAQRRAALANGRDAYAVASGAVGALEGAAKNDAEGV